MRKTVISTNCYNFIRTHFMMCCVFFYIISTVEI